MKFKNLYLRILCCSILLVNSYSFAAEDFFEENKILKQNNQVKLNIDYLNKIPEETYILGPGDVIYLSISDYYPELNSLITIDGRGTVKLPKLKTAYVEGLTLGEMNILLQKKYEDFIKYPDVFSEIIKYRTIKVIISGEVENPGLQVLDGSVIQRTQTQFLNSSQSSDIENIEDTFFPTVFDAIRSAGGITTFSDLSEVKVIRKNTVSNGGGLISTNLNFESLFDGNNSQNIRIYDGDYIEIKKKNNQDMNLVSKSIRSNLNSKYINIFVNGRVNTPGEIKIPKISSLNEALFIAGGIKAIKGPINLIRFNESGKIERMKIRYSGNAKSGSYRNPYLKNNDLVYVGKNIFNNTAEIIDEITSPFSGLVSAYGLYKAFQD